MTMARAPDEGLLFRTFVDNELVYEEWSPHVDVETIAARQHEWYLRSVDEGKAYRVEIVDPDLPEGMNTMRFGTTPEGMTNPMEVPLEDLGETAALDYIGRLEVGEMLNAPRKPKDDA
jgi:hypothetical protein